MRVAPPVVPSHGRWQARVAEALHGAEPGRLDEACRALGRIFTWRPTTRLAATEALDDPFFAQR
jgi:hypothetical protein